MYVDYRSLEPYGANFVPQFHPPVITAVTLDGEFCQRVIASLSNPQASGVYDSEVTLHKQVVDTYHRSSKAMQLEPELYAQVAQRMTAAVTHHTTALLGKPAFLSEPLQFLSYADVDKGHFLAHTDNAYYDAKGVFRYTSPHRQLTCIMYLNEDYEGGDLVLHSVHHSDGSIVKLHPATGGMVLFPSDIRFLHEVTPLTKGKRYSVVGWFSVK
jgi:predicted 2-oxoglutarate/Fe(II)-dependent dioxygenase YbiX